MVNEERLSLTSRLFIWSIVLDPLLFFVVADRSRLGITFAIGRALQVVVLSLLALQIPALLRDGKWRETLAALPRFLWLDYAIYFGLAVVAGIVGKAMGAYAVPESPTFNAGESGMAQAVNRFDLRPLIEYAITIYFFVYFVVLPRFILTTRRHLQYFFRLFRVMLVICLVIGFADIALNKVLGLEWLPRHLSDHVLVGPRFHGLAGEPRHAFTYLFLALAISHAQAYFEERTVSRKLVYAIITAAVLTQSASGMVGILCFGVLILIHGVVGLRRKELIRLVASMVVATLVIIAVASSNKRINMYFESLQDLSASLRTRRDITGGLKFQETEIYPLYDFGVKARHGEILPVMIGSGLGSASAVNNRRSIGPIQGLANPNSQLTRSLYESGVIGTIFFILAFTVPSARWTHSMNRSPRRIFMTMTLLVAGCNLGVRGTSPYILLGVLGAVFAVAPFVKPSPFSRKKRR